MNVRSTMVDAWKFARTQTEASSALATGTRKLCRRMANPAWVSFLSYIERFITVG